MSKNILASVLVAIGVWGFSGSVSALETITTDTFISDGNTSLDNQDVVVDGAVLTIDGVHTMTTLQVVNGGLVTHSVSYASGLNLSANTVVVDATSQIDVSALGITGIDQTWQAGGSYGGLAGGGSIPVYGDYLAPAELGTGGHCYPASNQYGGGRLKLQVQTLDIQGSIRADGSSPRGGCAGSSGGAIWIDADVISGVGTVSANGQAGYYGSLYGDPGGGGGGRIAIYYASLTGFDPLLQTNVDGGAGAGTGAAGESGTILLKQDSATQKILVTDSLTSADGHATIASLLSG